MHPRKQAEVMMRLLKLDFSALDTEYAEVEQERRDIGRDGKAVKAQLDAMPEDPDAPTSEVVVSDLVERAGENPAAESGPHSTTGPGLAMRAGHQHATASSQTSGDGA